VAEAGLIRLSLFTCPLSRESANRRLCYKVKGRVTNMTISVADMRRTPEGYFTVRWGQPEYTDWIDESMSWKETCYIGDWSFLWERRFRGPDVIKLFSDVSVNSFAKFSTGQSKHVIHCNETGKIIQEGILSRLGEDEFMLFGRGGFWVD
jgi:vanillate/3-O-methylgallate O-demethylase